MKTKGVVKFGEIKRKSWQKGKMFKDALMTSRKLRKTKLWRRDISEMLSPTNKDPTTSTSEEKHREEFHKAFLDFFRLPQLLREPLQPFGYVIYLARLSNNDYGYVVDRIAIENLVDDYEPLMTIFEKRLNFTQMKRGFLQTEFLEKYKRRVWTPLPLGTVILRASYSQASDSFGKARGNQCTAMCAAAIVMAHLVLPQRWDSDTMNNILTAGNDYYEDCTEAFGKCRYLAVNELFPVADFFGNWVELKFAPDPEYFGVTSFSSIFSCLDLFFRRNQFGIFMAQGKSLMVMRFGQDLSSTLYYLFDSHSCDRTGTPSDNGAACAMLCYTLRQLALALLDKYTHIVSQFTLDRVACRFIRKRRAKVVTRVKYRMRSYVPERGEVLRELIPESAIVLKTVLPYLFRRDHALRMPVPQNHRRKKFPSNVLLVFQCADGSCQTVTFNAIPGQQCLAMEDMLTCVNGVLVELPTDAVLKLNLPY